jgi:uncharacterized protein (TIGR00369 family)
VSADDACRWIEKSPFAAALGLRVESVSEEAARLSLPYRDGNANPGRALHGGVAASLAATGAQAVTRAALGAAAGPFHTCALQVDYLAAAIGEAVVAEARLLRRGKEMCFVEADVQTEDGKPVAHASAAVRGRFGAEPAAAPAAQGDAGESDPGPMGPHISKLPFVAGRGIVVEHMAGARSRLVMPWREANADAEGGLHEGALLALLDTTGAMAAWAQTGPGRFKASTPAIQAQILAPPGPDALVGFGRVVQRDRELFFCEVEIAAGPARALVARGSVIYRILT